MTRRRPSRPRCDLTDGAYQDLQDIRAYLILQGEDAWPIVSASLPRAFQRLAEFPNSGRVHTEWADRRYRFLPVYSYEVMYRVETDHITILRIIHGARDLRAILRGH